MLRFLVGTVVVVMLLIAASTFTEYQKTSKMTAEEKTLHYRYMHGRNLRCDQQQEVADRHPSLQFEYRQCIKGR